MPGTHMRLSYSTLSASNIARAIERLGEVARSLL
jgi:DNA-binding transcriptional MocR family regulator